MYKPIPKNSLKEGIPPRSIGRGNHFSYCLYLLMIVFVFINGSMYAQGTWTPVKNKAPYVSDVLMLLLSDGSVIAKTYGGGGSGNIWAKLTPDAQGSYANGTWSTIAPMINDREFFSSQILKDGRVYVAGGEYGAGGSSAEIYNPLTNSWTALPDPGHRISDANSEMLPDGRVLQALVEGSLTPTIIFDPATNQFVSSPSTIGVHNESVWIKLPDNSILFADNYSRNSERYIPSLNQWVVDATIPVDLYYGGETGSAFLLPDGRAFFIGATGATAFYTPSGNNNPGTWAAGPSIPNGQGQPDAAGSMMPNGKILLAVSPASTSEEEYPQPTSFYEFDYLTNSYIQIGAPDGGLTENYPAFIGGMLNLPDGTVLYTNRDNNQYYIYTPSGAQLNSGKPTIGQITPNDCAGSSYTITGTLFNGISEGSSYGDDWQMNTNYPVIRLTNGSNVYYARTYNWNSTGVQRGSSADNVQFTLPAGLPNATYSLVVTANGISSNTVSFTPSTCNNNNTCAGIPDYQPYPVIYNQGDYVKYNGIKYQSQSNGLYNVTPGTAEYWWKTIGACASSVAPTVAITSPLDGSVNYYYPSSNPQITATVTVNSNETPIDSVKYILVETVCDGPGCTNVRRFTTTTAPYSFTYTPALVGSGWSQLNAIAFSHGTASDQSTVTYYAKPLPELTIDSPSDGSSVSGSATSVFIDVTVNTNKLAIDSVVYTVFDTKTTGMSGVTTTRKFVVTSPYDLNLPIIAGNTFTRIFALAYGDGGKYSESKNIQINYNEVPTVTITAPAVGSKFNVGGSVTVSANATDSDGSVVKVEIYSPHIPNSTVTLTAPPYTATFSNLESSGIRGATTFVVKATDNKGGVNGASIDVIENRLPTITVTAPVPVNGINPKFLVGGSMTVSANVSDPDGSVTKVEISCPKSGVVQTITAAPYTATFTNLPAPYPDGSLSFTINAYDNNGGIANALIVTYKNRVPTVSITSPSNNATFATGSNIIISALFYDPDLTSGKVEYFNGATKLGQINISNSSSSTQNFTWNNVADGNYSLTTKVTDDMGESGTSTVVAITVGTTCSAQQWMAATAYSGNAIVQYNGIKYKANWWTQGDQPDLHNGISGSGQPWTSQGTCTSRMSAQQEIEANATLAVAPNPLDNFSNISVNLFEDDIVNIYVVDGLGRKVAEIYQGTMSQGETNLEFNSSNLTSGMYILKVDGQYSKRSMTLIKK